MQHNVAWPSSCSRSNKKQIEIFYVDVHGVQTTMSDSGIELNAKSLSTNTNHSNIMSRKLTIFTDSQ